MSVSHSHQPHWCGMSARLVLWSATITPVVANLERSSQWMSRSQVTRATPNPTRLIPIRKKKSSKKTTRVRNSTFVSTITDRPRIYHIIVTPSVSVLSSLTAHHRARGREAAPLPTSAFVNAFAPPTPANGFADRKVRSLSLFRLLQRRLVTTSPSLTTVTTASKSTKPTAGSRRLSTSLVEEKRTSRGN